METLFGQLIAEAIQTFTKQLNHLEHSSQGSWASRQLDSLDVVDADVSEGSTIFPESDCSCTADWCIFICARTNNPHEEDTYYLTLRLLSSTTTDEFITASHFALLQRPIAAKGKATLACLLDSGQMARRDMLKMLARSSEAQVLGRRVLIIPSPSSWLPDIEAGREGESVASVRVAR